MTPDDPTFACDVQAAFVRAFKTGVSPDGVKYRISPMEWNIYANMKEEDLHSRVSLHAHGKADIQQSAGKRSAEVTVILSRTKDARCLRVFQVE